jgi:hypothetical protein
MSKDKKYIGCKSWLCKKCKHYVKFLTVSTMQGICWNRGCFYESKDKIQPKDVADKEKLCKICGQGPEVDHNNCMIIAMHR